MVEVMSTTTYYAVELDDVDYTVIHNTDGYTDYTSVEILCEGEPVEDETIKDKINDLVNEFLG